MFLTGQCSKCGSRIVFDIGTLSKAEIRAYMEKTDFGECKPGWHVEVGKMSDYYLMDWKHVYPSMQAAKDHNARLQEAERQQIRVGG